MKSQKYPSKPLGTSKNLFIVIASKAKQSVAHCFVDGLLDRHVAALLTRSCHKPAMTLCRSAPVSHPLRSHPSQGFSLVELMIALTLGIVAIGAVGSLFVANKQVFRTQEGLGDVQEAGRLGFELLARDIRMAGSIGCPRTSRTSNVLENQSTDWWADAFGAPVIGYDASQTFASATNRVADTDAITIRRADTNGFSVASHNATSAQFNLNKKHTLKDNDVIIVCDSAQASVFQITNANQQNVTIVHNEGTGSIGNCSKFLGHPDSCLANAKVEKAGNCPDGFQPCEYSYGSDSTLALYEAITYYIGTNALGNRALYRIALSNALAQQELIEGVWDMQLTYGQDTSGDGQADRYQTATQIGAPSAAGWNQVVSVQVNLITYSLEDNVASGKQQYTATFGADTKTTATDNRLRKSFSGTAFVRNPQ